jgi:Low-density lipoprotein receptor domain class A
LIKCFSETTFLPSDYLANNLYWIDYLKSTIEVYSLNTKKRAVILHFSATDRPIAMALIPSRGEMFVALEAEGHLHIDRKSMKGGHDHFHVIESGLSKIGPIHIAVDEENQVVYWSDGENMKIEFSNFEGTNIKSFVRSNRKTGPMALIGGELYWTSLGSKTLQWRNKTGIGGVKMVSIEKPPGMRKMNDLINIVAGIPLKTPKHLCMINNGGCSDICLSDGLDNRACLCETGHFFKDNNRTVCIKRNNCGFICSTSGECLESTQRCNKKIECLDGSDEKDCATSLSVSKCGVSQFMCKDGQQCIPQEQRCDQHFNCRDHSDELNCTVIEKTEHCKRNQLRCPSGHCLDVTLRCDGKDDCSDSFDEREDVCQSACPVDFFKCASGQCIPKEFECNSYIDCQDISDEHAECRK